MKNRSCSPNFGLEWRKRPTRGAPLFDPTPITLGSNPSSRQFVYNALSSSISLSFSLSMVISRHNHNFDCVGLLRWFLCFSGRSDSVSGILGFESFHFCFQGEKITGPRKRKKKLMKMVAKTILVNCNIFVTPIKSIRVELL